MSRQYPSKDHSRIATTFLDVFIILTLLPGVTANCFIDDEGFERCDDGLSNAARIGIGIAGLVALIIAVGIIQHIRRRRLQKYYLQYIPPQGAPQAPVPPQPPQSYYANYTQYPSEMYGAYKGTTRYEEPSPQVVGVYSMYSAHVEPENPSAQGSPAPRYPPNVYSGGEPPGGEPPNRV